jgi:hypothetical protein
MSKKKTRPAKAVRAARFELVDLDGNLRATLAAEAQGIVRLEFFGADQQPYLHLLFSKHPGGETTCGLFDRRGDSFLTLGFQSDSGPPLLGLSYTRGPGTSALTLSPLAPFLEAEDAGGRRPLLKPPGPGNGSSKAGEAL